MDSAKKWDKAGRDTSSRIEGAANALKSINGKIVPQKDAVALLEKVIKPYDRVCVEGNNQKQANFLADTLASVDNLIVHDLHMLQSVVALPSHIDVFKKGIARKLDFSFSGPQSKEIAQCIEKGQIELGAIHTYVELYGRYLTDLTPRIALVAAHAADKNGNLYTGPNTEETPTIIEATKFKQGIVIVQVNEIVEKLPRVDIPGDWVDFIIETEEEYYIEPLFTRDPAKISSKKIVMAMMALKGIYLPYQVETLNHGIGYDTVAIELLLPTYGKELGLKGKACKHWALNPHPTMIPAIESGFVESIYAFGSEVGMEEYIKHRPDIFFVGPDGSLRSNRAAAQMAGQYAADMFIGSTLQIDQYGNSSTATQGRISGFGGAPNMGSNCSGRRHSSKAWLDIGKNYPLASQLNGDMPIGKKLVVQIVDSCKKIEAPTFVEKLDAFELAEKAKLPLPPVMIYGQDLTHIVTDVGIAYLYQCKNLEERRNAICSIAGKSPIGALVDDTITGRLRDRGIVKYPEDLDIDVSLATRDLLAAKSIDELVEWSDGLYKPPAKFLSK